MSSLNKRRVLVCGGRKYSNYSHLKMVLSSFEPAVVISGKAPGADSLAERWAKEAGVKFEGYPADWKTNGRAAGPIRNQQMLDEGKPDFVIAFPGGKGTADMVKRAKAACLPVISIRVLTQG